MQSKQGKSIAKKYYNNNFKQVLSISKVYKTNRSYRKLMMLILSIYSQINSPKKNILKNSHRKEKPKSNLRIDNQDQQDERGLGWKSSKKR